MNIHDVAGGEESKERWGKIMTAGYQLLLFFIRLTSMCSAMSWNPRKRASLVHSGSDGTHVDDPGDVLSEPFITLGYKTVFRSKRKEARVA